MLYTQVQLLYEFAVFGAFENQ